MLEALIWICITKCFAIALTWCDLLFIP